MRNIVSAILFVALSGATCAASAQDNWTGWYMGGQLGHASANASTSAALGGAWSSESAPLQSEVVTGLARDLDANGTTYGLFGGYNHQFASGFVLGFELGYDQINADEAVSTGLQPTTAFPSLEYDFQHAIELNHQTTLRTRLGYASNRHLFYVSGGWTQVDIDASTGMLSNGGYKKLGTVSKRANGTQWGVGYEYDFGNRWSLRGEYLRTNTGSFHYDTDYLPGSSFTSPAYSESIKQDLDVDTFQLGVSYRF